MDERRILEIFWGYLNDQPIDEATFSASRQIKKELLADILSGADQDKEKLEIALKISDAHTKIGYFIQDPVTTITKAQGQYFKHLEFLFKTLGNGIRYILDNYETTGTEIFRKNNTKSELENSIKIFADENNSRALELATTGTTAISQEQSLAIKRTLEKMLFVILGEQIYKRLTEESTKVYPVIARYQIEVLNNKHDKTH